MCVNLIYSDVVYEDSSHEEKIRILLESPINFEYNLIKDVNITDSSLKYYIIYPLQGHYSVKLVTGQKVVSDSILDKIRSGYDITILFCTEAECEFEDSLDIINKWSSNLGLDNKKIYSISGNSKLENVKTHEINILKTFNPIINRIALTMKLQKPENEVEWLNDRKYTFQCYNNMPKEHRLILLSFLHKNDILKNVDWSLMRPFDRYHVPALGIDSLDKILDLSTIEDLKDSYKEILNDGKSKYSEYEDSNIRNPHADGEPDHNITYKNNPHKNAYINIVNESQFELIDTIHITEKSIIPFYFNQLPLFVATQGHVKKLKDLYQFDVFDDIIDHSYDSIENPQDRMHAIINEIIRLNSIRNDVIEFCKNNKTRFYENRQIVNKISNIHPYNVIFEEFINS